MTLKQANKRLCISFFHFLYSLFTRINKVLGYEAVSYALTVITVAFVFMYQMVILMHLAVMFDTSILLIMAIGSLIYFFKLLEDSTQLLKDRVHKEFG